MQRQEGSKKDALIVAADDDAEMSNPPKPYQIDIDSLITDPLQGYETVRKIRVRMYWGLLKNFVLLIDGMYILAEF